jgi:manganese/zinc/iron transport system permease protein
MRRCWIIALLLVSTCSAQAEAAPWQRVLTLQDYNTRVVLLGTLMLGLAGGLVGSFMVLRKKALLADAVSHATLPGLALAFILMATLGGTGKHLGGLLLGATVTGLLGMGAVQLIRTTTRLKEDAALGIVLSVFFGLGVSLLGLVQKMETGSAAGLESFIYGKTASMLASDGWRIALAAACISALCGALFKVLAVLCFDPDYARAQGWPVAGLDALLMGMVVAVTVVGLQAVGLILVVALLVIPAASARFWSDDLRVMVALSTSIGGISCLLGALWSALTPRLPAGAMMVLVASAIFMVSLLAGRARGVVARALAYRRMVRHLRSQRGGAGMVTP